VYKGWQNMAEVKWIKITTDIFANRKIKQIMMMPESDAIIVIWFHLLCLAGEVNEKGLIRLTQEVPYTDEMLANEFHKPLNIVRMALSLFEKFNMVEIIDNIYCISNWEKYQNIDKLEEIKEKTRLRVARHRERVKLLTVDSNATVTLPVTPCNALDIDKDKDIELDKENIDSAQKPAAKKFAPPSLKEVTDYCNERQNDVNPQRFIDFYTSNGWKVGKNKMKDWKAAVRTWEQRNKEGTQSFNRSGPSKPNFQDTLAQRRKAIETGRGY
jgi:predicted phage replisome organizer